MNIWGRTLPLTQIGTSVSHNSVLALPSPVTLAAYPHKDIPPSNTMGTAVDQPSTLYAAIVLSGEYSSERSGFDITDHYHCCSDIRCEGLTRDVGLWKMRSKTFCAEISFGGSTSFTVSTMSSKSPEWTGPITLRGIGFVCSLRSLHSAQY